MKDEERSCVFLCVYNHETERWIVVKMCVVCLKFIVMRYVLIDLSQQANYIGDMLAKY